MAVRSYGIEVDLDMGIGREAACYRAGCQYMTWTAGAILIEQWKNGRRNDCFVLLGR